MDRRGFIGAIIGAAGSALMPSQAQSGLLVSKQAKLLVTPNALPGLNAVSNLYPLSIGGMDPAYLFPFASQIYDSEIVTVLKETAECDGSELKFFDRPISQMMAEAGIVKEHCDTNLNQSQMMDYPVKFQVTGVGVFLDAGICAEDKTALINNGYLMVLAHGNRPYAIIPLMLMPTLRQDGVAPEESIPVKVGEFNIDVADRVHHGFIPLRVLPVSCDGVHHRDIPKNKLEEVSNTFVLKPGENFCVKLCWSRKITLSKPVKIMVALDGYAWRPL